MNTLGITHALLSVSDKSGIVEFARALCRLNITLLSTGGTATLLKKNQIPVIDISDFTGFPELMDGRVKTLHPKIHAGILGRPDVDEEILEKYKITSIGLVVVNLYPFQKIIANDNCSLESAIENIDIGGPTLLRAAAKNYKYTTAIVSQDDYSRILSELERNNHTSLATRFYLAKKVFAHVAQYDAVISNYFSSFKKEDEKIRFPEYFTLQFEKKMDLRYGENPHQTAAFYMEEESNTATIASAVQRIGKPLSFNNIADADCALECVRQFSEKTCVIVKHANPCGVAIATTQEEAYQRAYAADPTSAFGGIIAFNSFLEASTVEKILSQQFVEVIIAPDTTREALKIAEQKPNVRILTVGDISIPNNNYLDLKRIHGGLLVQDTDNLSSILQLDVVSNRTPNAKEQEDLLFAWKVIRFVKSNAIVYAKAKSTLGIGAGQMSRVFSAKIGIMKAKEADFSLDGAVMASDAFFPFRDSIDQAAEMGITAIIQPGGSIRDKEVIEAANNYNIAMIFTHMRHFRH